MPRALQTGDTQAICIERPDSFIDRCISLTDAALERQPLVQNESPAKPVRKPKRKNAA